MIDITDSVLAVLDRERARPTHDESQPLRSSHPQAATMFAKLSAHHSRTIAKQPTGFHDFDESLNFQVLAVCLARHVDPVVPQSHDEPLRPDPEVARLFHSQLANTLNRHQAACLKNGLWRVYYDREADRFHACLTRRRRLSALLAVNAPAQLEALDRATAGHLSSGNASDDDVYFAFASSAEHLRFVSESAPESWAAFTNAVGFTGEELTAYVGFLVFLGFAAETVGHTLWYDVNKFLRLREIFCEAFDCSVLTGEALMRLTDLFSLTPATAADYSLPVPFFRIGDSYLRYHGFDRVMSPAMSLLTIAIRTHESVWSRTLGTTLVYAADVLAASLPRHARLEVGVRRGISGKGDIDLVLYDTVNRHMLLCEVKTVYDKYRTVHQMHGFEEAKVNVVKAIGQLRRAIAAVRSGELSTTVLFGKPLPEPLRIDAALLTWLDSVDLTMASPNEDVLSVNFATLRYLVDKCHGDVSAVVRTVHELRNVWWIATRRPLDLGQPEVHSDLEVQVPVFDAWSDLEELALSPTTMDELKLFPSIAQQSRDDQHESDKAVSYLADTRQVLSKT